jgi:hypothetical protein
MIAEPAVMIAAELLNADMEAPTAVSEHVRTHDRSGPQIRDQFLPHFALAFARFQVRFVRYPAPASSTVDKTVETGLQLSGSA